MKMSSLSILEMSCSLFCIFHGQKKYCEVPLILTRPIQYESQHFMRTASSILVCLFATLLVLQGGQCALNELADEAIKIAIKAAVEDGLHAVDSLLRKEYWQFLTGTKLTFYNVTVLVHELNYKIIYIFGNNVYRANCNIDKVTWEPFLNSLTRLPSYLATQIDSKRYEQLFMLNTRAVEIMAGKSRETALKAGIYQSSQSSMNLKDISGSPSAGQLAKSSIQQVGSEGRVGVLPLPKVGKLTIQPLH